MSLNAIYDALNRHLQNGVIDLYAAARAEPQVLGGLQRTLDDYAIRAAFVLSGAELERQSERVLLHKGRGQYGLGNPATPLGMLAELSVQDLGAFAVSDLSETRNPELHSGSPVSDRSEIARAQLGVPTGGSDVFILSFDFGSGRSSFGALFPGLLPDYEQVQDNQAIALTKSFLYELGLSNLQLIARSDSEDAKVAVSGKLEREGVLNQYTLPMLSWPLEVSGSVQMPRADVVDDSVALDLLALDSRARLQFYSNELTDVGLQLRALRGLDEDVNLVRALSLLDLVGSLVFASNPPVRLSVPLTASGDTWRLLAELPPGLGTIGNAIAALAGLLGLQPDDLLRPLDFLGLDLFYLATIEVAFAPLDEHTRLLEGSATAATATVVPTLRWLAVTVRSDHEWTPPIPFVSVDRVGARWVVMWPGSESNSRSVWGGSVFGGLTLGPANEINALTGEPEAFTLDVTARLPQFVVSGRLRRALTLPIGQAISEYIGSGTPGTPPGMSLSSFWFLADPNARTFRAEAAIDMDWRLSPFKQVVFDLTGMSFFVDVQQSSVSAGLAASIRLDDEMAENGRYPTVTVAATGERAQGQTSWTFSGSLLPGAPLSLTRIALRLLDVDTREWSNFPSLQIDTLDFTIQTGEAGYYHAKGSASLLWSPRILDTDLRIAVDAGAEVTKPTGGTASGTVGGGFALNQLAMRLGFDFGVPNPTWRFRIQFGEPWVELTTYTTSDTPPHRILTAQLGGVTLGSIIEYLVNLAAPTLGYRLDPPWDALNRVDLSRFLLSLDLATSTVSITMNLPINLGVMQISALSLKYTRGAGLSGVELVLAGRFFGEEKSLGWDVVRDPPPAVPGSGGALIDLYYLALGQRVRPADDKPVTVRQYLDAMEKAMQPLPPGSSTPPPIGNGVIFAEDSEWLIGLDIDLAQTFRLGLLFNDPRLYGLSIALRGPKAGSFGGLDFQLLYKKISDNVGMFRIDLALPLAMRSFTIGPVAITLGTIALEIYTNGNFTVDFGFPWKRDFSRAFTLQYFPFIGRGGIYFGYLNGATSSRVPKITSGTFDPVIELGVGLAVGVGKEVIFGPLSGGAYVQIEVLFLGVFGWYNPSDHGRNPAVFFRAEATAAIVGKVYGTVDFKVIKVSVTLMAEAEVSVIFEIYRAAQFHLQVRVTAEAEVKILFIKISFSFKVSLALDFTAGSDQATPWTLADNSSNRQGFRLVALRRSPARRLQALASTAARLARRRGLHLTADQYRLNFDPKAPIFTGGRKTLALHMIPAFTLSDLPIAWTGSAPDNPDPQWRIALLLAATTGIDPKASSAKERRQRRGNLQAANANEQPAHLMAEALLRWALYAVTQPDPASIPDHVSAAQLRTLAEQLDLPQAADQAFALKNLGDFFSNSLLWQIAGDPGGDPDILDAMLLPLPPDLKLIWDQPVPGERVLADTNRVGATYLAEISAYQQRFQPYSGKAPGSLAQEQDEAREAYASHAFRDWCLMLTKAVVKAARAQLDHASVTLTAPASLAEVAERFPRASVEYRVQGGDTLAQVAQTLGASVEELLALNPDLPAQLAQAQPGTLLPVQIGVAAALVAQDNPSVSLKPGVYPLGPLQASVRAGDSFASMATRFELPDAAALASAELYADVKLLGADQRFDTVALNYTFAVDVAAGLGAAVFFARWFDCTGLDAADWYAQTIALWNAPLLVGLDPMGSIAPGTALRVPTAYLHSESPPAQPNYTTLAGDTPRRIGAALALAQIYPSGEDPAAPAGWARFRDAVVQSGRAISLPASTLAVEAGESLSMLGLRTLVHTDNAGINGPALLNWLGSSPVLAALTLIHVSGARVDTGKLGTVERISEALGISPAQIGALLAEVPGLLQADPEHPLTLHIAALPLQWIETLISDTLAGTAVADLAGQVSRQSLSGLRLPAPLERGGIVHAEGPMTAFAELCGQQLIGPPPGENTEPGSGLTLRVQRFGELPWVEFVDATTTQPDTVPALLQQYPQLHALNRGLAGLLADNAALPPGQILRLVEIGELTFRYSAAELKARYPARNMLVTPVMGPRSLPLAALSPASFDLSHDISLQTAKALALPGDQSALTGQPQLYPFPAALRALAHAGQGGRYEVLLAAHGDSANSQARILPNATFVAAVRLRITRSQSDPPVYTLVGSDSDGREVLLDLRAHLGGGAVAYLAVAPDPAAADPIGLNVLDLASPSDAFLVKTNLSTASVPDSVERSVRTLAALSDPQTILDSATLAAPADFAQLLFEGSVVGGAGYYLSLRQRDGRGINPGAFDAQGRAELWFIVLSAQAQQPAPNGRVLESFVNAAVLAAGTDLGSRGLSIVACDDQLGSMQATVPPGHAGFELQLPNPRAESSLAALAPSAIAQLYGVVDYALGQPGSTYQASLPGLAVYPRDRPDPQWQQQRQTLRRQLAGLAAPADDPNPDWHFQLVLPVYAFGPDSLAPAVPALPDPGLDPYRGLGGASAQPQAEFAVGLRDVFGNASRRADAKTVDVAIGYTDPLLGPDAWPATRLSYALEGQAPNGRLSLRIEPMPASIWPALGEDADSAGKRALQQAERYAQAWYQWSQPRLAVETDSSLYGLDRHRPFGAGPGAFWSYISAQYLASRAQADLQAVLPASVSVLNLNTIVQRFGFDLDALGQANAALSARSVLAGDAVPMPGYVVVQENDSAEGINARTPTGVQKPGAAAMLKLPGNAKRLPLRAGTVLAIKPLSIQVPDTQPTPALDDLAAGAHSSAGWLGSDNAEATVLREGFAFEVDGVVLLVNRDAASGPVVRSLHEACTVYAGLGVHITPEQLATEVGAAADLLQSGALLSSSHYIVPAPTAEAPFETLADNHSGSSVDELADRNTATVNLFDSGAMVYVGDYTQKPHVADDDLDTLAQWTARFGATPSQLLQRMAEAGVDLPASSALTVPGLLQFSDGAPRIAAVALPIKPVQLVARFAYVAAADEALRQFVGEQLNLPLLLNPGVRVSALFQGVSYSVDTIEGDRLATVLHRLQQQQPGIDIAALSAGIADNADLLRAGAVIVTPPAQLEADTSAAQCSARYGLPHETIASANLGLRGLLLAGAVLHAPGDSGQQLQVLADDSWNAVLLRFAALGVETDLAAVLSANPDTPIYRKDARLLLPAAAVIHSEALIADVACEPVAALEVGMRSRRPPELVDPAFADGPVAQVTSSFQPEGAASDADSRAALAAALRAALPTVRLASGKVPDQSADLWLIDFGNNGIRSASLQPGAAGPNGATWPRFYALRPLYSKLISLHDVRLPVIQPDGSIKDAEFGSDFVGIDAEPWARRFLEDLDGLLSAGNATAWYRDNDARKALTGLLAAKRLLVNGLLDDGQPVPGTGIAAALAPVLQAQAPAAAGARDAAGDALVQALGASLSSAYASAGVVQYDTAVDSAWTRNPQLPPARLYGDGLADPASPVAYGLGHARIDLAAPTGYAQFLLTLDRVSEHRDIVFRPRFVPTHLEWNIRALSLPGSSGFESSNWLTLIPALDATVAPASLHIDTGNSRAPIPLRSYPALPSVQGQSASASVNDDPSLAQRGLWDYGLRYRHEHAAQDELVVSVRFNRAQSLARADVTSTTLAQKLARYQSVAAPLIALSAGIGGSDNARAARAAGALSELAGEVAPAWANHFRSVEALERPQDLSTESVYWLDVQLLYSADGSRIDGIQLSCLADPDQPGSAVTAPGPDGQWPQLLYRNPAGTAYPLVGDPVEPDDRTRRYRFEGGEPDSAAWAEIDITYVNLAIAQWQNALGSVAVVRNRALIEQMTTAEDFIYASARVEASSTITPLLRWTDAVDIGAGQQPVDALREALKTLLGRTADGLALAVGVGYGYRLAGSSPDSALETVLPVHLLPRKDWNPQLATALAQALDTWQKTNQPRVDGGFWSFSVTLYSSLDGPASPPLLTLERLAYRLA